MDRVREAAGSQLSGQKNRVMEGLGSLAQAARRSTQSFRDTQQDTVAQYIEKAADQIEQFSVRVRERDVTELVQDVQQFARRRPVVFIGAAFAFGVVAARFLKSSGTAVAVGNPDTRLRAGSTGSRAGEGSSRLDRPAPVTPRLAGGAIR